MSGEPSSLFSNSSHGRRAVKKLEISIYDELRRILSVQTTQEGNPMVLYLAKFMTSTSIVVQRESVGCLAELAQVRPTLIDIPWTKDHLNRAPPRVSFRIFD